MNAQPGSSVLPQMARLFAAEARLYCLSALIAGALGIAALTAVSIFMVRGAGEGPLDARTVWQSMTFSHQLIALFGMLFGLWTPVLLAARAVCWITTEKVASRPVSLAMAGRTMATFIPAAVIYSVIIGLPAMIGATIFLVPGIVVASLFVLVVPISVNERLGVFSTVGRALSLGGNVFLKELLFTTISAVLVVLVVVFRNVVFSRLVPGTQVYLFPVKFALVYLPALLVLVLVNICFTLLYYEARGRQPLVPLAPAQH